MTDDRKVVGAERWFALAEEQQHELAMRLHNGGGGGTSGGMSDDWKTDVERQLGQLHGDVRGLLYGLVGGFLFLLAAGGAAYANLSGQVADTRKDVAAVQVELAKVNGKLNLLLERSKPASER